MEEDIEYWKEKAAAVEGLLGYATLLYGPFRIEKDVINKGLPEGAHFDIVIEEDALVVELVSGDVV